MRSTLILFIALSCFGSNAQTKQQGVVPLEQYHNYKTNDNLKLSDVTYFKDVNNHLDKFVGTWVGGYDNNTLTLEITILEQVEGLGLAFDELLIKYKIEDDSGNEIVNTLPFPDFYKYHISGKFFADTTSIYTANYYGYEVECNQKGYAILKFIDNNTMNFWIAPSNDMIGPGCSMGNIHIMPTKLEDAVVMTKQN